MDKFTKEAFSYNKGMSNVMLIVLHKKPQFISVEQEDERCEVNNFTYEASMYFVATKG